MTESPHLMVFTTLPTAEGARTLVRGLLDARLVACGTVLDHATSIYRWEGAIEESAEAQVILKTRRDRWDDLVGAVRAAHPYDVPELVAVPVADGLPTYLAWVTEETTGGETT